MGKGISCADRVSRIHWIKSKGSCYTASGARQNFQAGDMGNKLSRDMDNNSILRKRSFPLKNGSGI